MGVEALHRLGVVERPVDAPTKGNPDHHRRRPAAVGSVVDPGRLRDDLVEGGMDVVGELDLGDGVLAGGGHAHRGPHDQRLGQRAVEAAVRPVGLGEALGGLEHAPLGIGDVLAEHQRVGPVGEHLVERPVHRRDEVDGLADRLGLGLGGGLRGDDDPGVHVAVGIVRSGGRLRPLHRLRQLGGDLILQLVFHRLGEEACLDEVLLEDGERIVAAPLLHLLPAAVEPVVIVRGVGVVAVGAGFDEGGSLSPAGPLGGLLDHPVDGEGLVAVDGHAVHPVAGGAVGNHTGDLLRSGDGDGVLVVLDDDDEGKAVDAGEVHRLVPVPLGSGTLTPVDHHDPGSFLLLQHVRDAGGVGELGGDGRGVGEHVEAGIRPVIGQLAAPAGRVVLLGEDREEDVVGRHSPRQGHSHVPVVGQHPVDPGVHREHAGHLRRLVARRGDHEGGASLAVEGPHAVVEAAGEQDRSVHGERFSIGEAELGVALLEVLDEFHRCRLLPSLSSGRRRSAGTVSDPRSSASALPRSTFRLRTG